MAIGRDMDKQLLERTARELVASGKGILAADESNGTMSSRLKRLESNHLQRLEGCIGPTFSQPRDMSQQ